MLSCNDGVCGIEKPTNKEELELKNDLILYYIGDPMCSWCWGFSNILKDVQEFCTKNGINFNLLLGGLRVGGGDVWSEEFKNFLRTEWGNIGKITGQKFVFDLFDKESFNYDTEPSCRAIFVARILLNSYNDNNKKVLEFFSAVQSKFYTKAEDTTQIDFYKSICEDFGIIFEEFKVLFNSNSIKKDLLNEFNKARALVSSGMPSLVLVKDGKKFDIGSGFRPYESVIKNIEKVIKN